jgi:peroxiredoxin
VRSSQTHRHHAHPHNQQKTNHKNRRQAAVTRHTTAARRAAPAPATISRRRAVAARALAVGDKLPDAKFRYFDAEGNMKEMSTDQLCKGRKVVLFAVPGAFTPTCSLKHLPGFVDRADELRLAGVDAIACVSVNDAFVMDAWGKQVGAAGKVMMLADGNGQFARAAGVELDLSDKGLGVRSRRYALLADDGVVKTLNLEEGGAFTVSSAETILEALGA